MKRPKYKIVSLEDLERVSKNVFKNYEEVQLAYLYGSYAKNLQNVYSDIDMGVVLKDNFEEAPLYFAELSSKIEKFFNYKINVDLRILNQCTPRFLFNVINEGKVLYVRNTTFMHEFELKVIYQYQDIKPMLDLYDNKSIMEALDDEY
ncbi:MAG: nucleotidyltransferase domain-containing protein [Candidatus Lokiarchaeota archaeon]